MKPESVPSASGCSDDAAVDLGMAMARKIFAKRGNHYEIHLTEGELAGLFAAAYSTGVAIKPPSETGRSAVIEECIAAVREHRLYEDLDNEGDKGYMAALADCEKSIRALKNAAPQASRASGSQEQITVAPAVAALDASAQGGAKEELTPDWCADAFWRVNPGRNANVPSLYLLDFAREVLRVFARSQSGESSPLANPENWQYSNAIGAWAFLPLPRKEQPWALVSASSSIAQTIDANWPKEELEGAPRTRECLAGGTKTIGQVRADLETLCVTLERELAEARRTASSIERIWIPVSERLPGMDDMVLVFGRERDGSNPDMPYYDMPWCEPDINLVRGWWVVENSDTPAGLAERERQKKEYGYTDRDATKLGAQSLFWMPLPFAPSATKESAQ